MWWWPKYRTQGENTHVSLLFKVSPGKSLKTYTSLKLAVSQRPLVNTLHFIRANPLSDIPTLRR